MEKHRICKICNKRFSNGKAMGGHMRSHLVKLPVPPKPQSPQQQQLSISPELSHPFSSSNRGMHSSSSLLNRTPSLDSAVHDGYSDSESHPRNPTRRRSKRRRKVIGKVAAAAAAADEQVSSVSDTFSTEDVARCLMMLSRDKWDKVKLQKGVNQSVDEDEDEDEDEEDDDNSGFRAQTRVRTQGKYKCETCNKVFRSYQALGGHRASHKKIKTQVFDEDEDEDDDEFEEEDDANVNGNNNGNLVVDQQRQFECSFCFKLFDSGQALGGHKKVHYYNNLVNNANNARNVSSSSANFGDNLVIDLNLPAPEEEEDEEVSQAEFSTVSD